MSNVTTRYYSVFATSISVFAVVAGVIAGYQPQDAGWRFFSYHPLLMTVGFVGMMGNAVLVKKLGGYKNTKLHGYLTAAGLLMVLCGGYVIYRNKENMGKAHLTSLHSKMGFGAIIGAIGIGIAGATFLHPDFGMAKTNSSIRLGHKWGGRIILVLAWYVCFTGLSQLTRNYNILFIFGAPLIVLMPFVLT